MKQSYKIFINNIVVILAQHKLGFKLPKRIDNITIYTINKASYLEKLITAIEIGSIAENLIILSDDVDWLHENFLKKFKIIVAGGGIVTNEEGKVLMMFRKKKWDLPKGKIEKEESIRDGAIREIEEETGVKVLSINRKLGKTYHTYKLKDNWVLKETHWFLMEGDGSCELIPETKEGIEKVEWCSKKIVKAHLKNSYVSIRDVFDYKKL
ncbi:MAG: 8-oxo-dGTP pyrophosphatase MutT (NUDIX family) [Chitinophagales bacterium]|jgi:8-oxo-dGTP pyrophosphatase MutT (NUDIX family)